MQVPLPAEWYDENNHSESSSSSSSNKNTEEDSVGEDGVGKDGRNNGSRGGRSKASAPALRAQPVRELLSSVVVPAVMHRRHTGARIMVSSGGADAFEVLPEYAVTVASFEVGNDCAEFLLRVERENGGDSVNSEYPRSWVTPRTFRDFTKFHRTLKNLYPDKMKRQGVLLPSTTSTSAFSQNMLDPSKLEARRVQLDYYFQSVLSDVGENR